MKAEVSLRGTDVKKGVQTNRTATEDEGVVAAAMSMAVMTVVAMTAAVVVAAATSVGEEEGILVWGKLQSATAPQGIPPYTVLDHMTQSSGPLTFNG